MFTIQGKITFILLILSLGVVSSCGPSYNEKQAKTSHNPTVKTPEEEPYSKVLAQGIDRQLEVLLEMPEMPSDMGEKIKKALESNQKEEKKEALIYYGEILSLLQNINTYHPGTKFSKDSQLFLDNVKLELKRIIKSDKKEQEREQLK